MFKKDNLLWLCLITMPFLLVGLAMLIGWFFDLPHCSLCMEQRNMILCMGWMFFLGYLSPHLHDGDVFFRKLCLTFALVPACWGLRIAVLQTISSLNNHEGVCYLASRSFPILPMLSTVSFVFFIIITFYLLFSRNKK